MVKSRQVFRRSGSPEARAAGLALLLDVEVAHRQPEPDEQVEHGSRLRAGERHLRVALVRDAHVGHEVAHVLAQHANERVSTQAATQTGLSVLQSAAGLDSQSGQQLMGLLGMGAEYGIIKPFSRKQESEADVLGLELMAQAGFDPRASINLWQNMSANSQGQPPVWMSTHPSDGQRIEGLQAQMDQALAAYQQARANGRTPNCQRPS